MLFLLFKLLALFDFFTVPINLRSTVFLSSQELLLPKDASEHISRHCFVIREGSLLLMSPTSN